MSDLKTLVMEWVEVKKTAERLAAIESSIADALLLQGGAGAEIQMPTGEKFKVRKKHGVDEFGLSPVKEKESKVLSFV